MTPILVASIIGLGLVVGGVAVAMSRHGTPSAAPSSPAPISTLPLSTPSAVSAGGAGVQGSIPPVSVPPAGASADHDYLWDAYNLTQQSAQDRLHVQAAIRAKDSAALITLQERRRELLMTVEGWRVPRAAAAANSALEQALQYSIISDGNWANYASGTMTYDAAVAYDAQFTHPAKWQFVRLYNRLCKRLADAPPTYPANFLF
jgi:hypothetical protein